uniref:Uncharacterized protein n=1 Tax=Clastoptera arizonana TaxID=38151 RepID=A0A1B6CEW7_9HEMI
MVSQVEVELRHYNTVKLENDSGEIYLGNKNTHELSFKSLLPHQEIEGSNIVEKLCKERVQNTTKDVMEENFKFKLDTSNKLIDINTRSNEISVSNGGNNNMNNVGNKNSKFLQNLQENVAVSGSTDESKRNDGKKEGKVISDRKLSFDCVHSFNLPTEKIKNENMEITRNEVIKNSNKEKNYRNQIVLNSVIKIEQSLRAWFTIDSLCFLYGEDTVKEKLHKKNESLKTQQFVDENTQVDPHLYERYLMICKKLNIVEIKDQIFNSNLKKAKGIQNPIPDYAQLKEESKRIDLKVKQFFRGDNVVKFQDKSVIEGENSTLLPLVDIYAQKSLRKKIVMDKLFLVYPELQHILELQPVNLTEDIKTLINTFKLSANNITFIPAEWNLISLIIFKLLSIKNQIMYQLLNRKIKNMNLTLLLLSYKLEESYLDKVVMWLTDIDQILKNQN